LRKNSLYKLIEYLLILHFTTFSRITKLQIKLNIYDVLGKKIAELFNKEIKPGEYSLDYNANNFDHSLSSGIYFYSLQSAESVDTKKMVYLK